MYEQPVKWLFIFEWIKVVTIFLKLFLSLLKLSELSLRKKICSQYFGCAADYLVQLLVHDLRLDKPETRLVANSVH